MRTVKIGLYLVVLFIGVAVVSIWTRNNYDCASICVGGCRIESAYTNRMDQLRLEDVGPTNAPPKQQNPFLLLSVLNLLCGERQWGHLEYAVGSNNGFCNVYFGPRLCEIDIIRHLSLKIVNICPPSKMRCSSTSEVLENRNDRVIGRIPRLIVSNELVGPNVRDDRPQLFTRVRLGFIGDTPLLVDEKISYDVGGEQKGGPENQPSGEPINWRALLKPPAIPWACALVGGALAAYGFTILFGPHRTTLTPKKGAALFFLGLALFTTSVMVAALFG